MEYINPNIDKRRQQKLAKQREKQQNEFEQQKKQILEDSRISIGSEKFVSENNSFENKLKNSTVGLVKLEDFQRIHKEIEEEKLKAAVHARLEKQKRSKTRAAVKQKKGKKLKLSFEIEEEEAEEGEGEGEEGQGEEEGEREESEGEGKKAQNISGEKAEELESKKNRAIEKDTNQKGSLGKNPFADTSFLPDKEREAQDVRLREELRKQWYVEQERLKNEEITIVYSYWDGAGHRNRVKCKKGDTIQHFLEKCKVQLKKKLSLTLSVDNLMYIKEDLIIPTHYTFYDFIINKARGKSGPLFSFGEHEDVRLVNDATIEKEDVHVGKVCERSWYEKNKHIFPANRWELYDPQKDYGGYAVK